MESERVKEIRETVRTLYRFLGEHKDYAMKAISEGDFEEACDELKAAVDNLEYINSLLYVLRDRSFD